MDRAPSGRPWHLAAVWFADIVGYSRLASESQDRALDLVQRFHREVREHVERRGGRVVKFTGDGALAEFSSTDAAARSAYALASAFGASTAGALRIGLHVGDIARDAGGDILGEGVNLAARLQAEAEPGQVLVSENAWQQLRHRDGYEFAPLGGRAVKGFAEPVPVYAIVSCDVSELALEEVDEDTAAPPAGAGSEPGTPRLPAARGGLARWVAGTAMVGAAVVAIAWFTGRDPAPPIDPTRLAVLYFDDNSPGQRLRYLADGLTEALIHELSQVPALSVVSRNGVKPFRGASVPLDSIVRVLHVGSVVEGSVVESGGRVRVTVQLIDAASGSERESSVAEYPAGDLLALQDSVVGQAARMLRQALGEEVRLRQVRMGTREPAALELVMRASSDREDYLALRFDDTDAGLRILARADSALERAEKIDPRWAYPSVLRGWIARDFARLGAEIPGRYAAEWGERALQHAERAVRIRPDDPEALELRGVLQQEYSRDASGERRESMRRAAEADLRRAVELDPQRARAWLGLSELLLDEARFPEAKLAAEKAMRADAFLEIPPSAIHQLYWSAAQLGPREDARHYCDLGRQRFPDNSDFIVCQLFILASFPQVQPDVARAWVLADSLVPSVLPNERESFYAFGRMLVAEVAARAGLADSARAIIRLARAASPDPDVLAYNEAHARLLLGEEDAAVDLLSRYLKVSPDTALMASDWWLAALRSNPRFQAMVGRAN